MEAVWPSTVEQESACPPSDASLGLMSESELPPAEATTALESVRAETFDELYRNHFEYVWQSAHRLGVRPEEIDDVVQETFLVVHRLLGKYEQRGTTRGWLFAILYRVNQRYKRTIRRWLSRWDAEASLDTVAEASMLGPERRAEAEEEARHLEAILDKLNPEQRAVLVLAEIEERPLTEVAEILGINVYTARSRLRLARERVESGMARFQARDLWRLK